MYVSIAAASEFPPTEDVVIKIQVGAGIDLIDVNVVNAVPTLVIPTPMPRATENVSIPITAASTIPNKGSRAYLTMHEFSAMHQVIIDIENNLDGDDLLDLKDLITKNRRRRRRHVRKIRRLQNTTT